MKSSGTGFIMRIYVGDSDFMDGKSLYEVIVLKARELGLAGATVIRGIMGYGAHSFIHTAKILRISDDLPMIIEIVDSMENLEKIKPFLEENVKEGLITLEKVEIIKYRKA
jgi:hypothetical protein